MATAHPILFTPPPTQAVLVADMTAMREAYEAKLSEVQNAAPRLKAAPPPDRAALAALESNF